ncbi:hypothetical protein ACFL2Q_11885 [Thermodesulfobacteriota bacterium]
MYQALPESGLEECLKVSCLASDQVFLMRDKKGVRPLKLEPSKKPWPRFHDLRHTWRTNARRSGMNEQIAESIMGHYLKGKSVNDRYGRISDQELLNAIDGMTFDHGATEISVSGL